MIISDPLAYYVLLKSLILLMQSHAIAIIIIIESTKYLLHRDNYIVNYASRLIIIVFTGSQGQPMLLFIQLVFSSLCICYS